MISSLERNAGTVILESESVDRTIKVRPGIGAAAEVLQNAELTSHRIHTDSPMLVLIETGSKTLRWVDGQCTMNAGDAVALASGQTFDITNRLGPEGQYRARWIAWDRRAIDDFAERSKRDVPVLKSAKPIFQINPHLRISFNSAFDGVRDLHSIPEPIASHRSVELLVWLHQLGITFNSPNFTSTWSAIRKIFLGELSRHWTVDDVAKRLHISPATLRRRLAGERIIYRELLQDVRMSHALTLLQSTDLSVLDVALAVGYDSASRFAVRFRSRFDYSPSDVRGHRRGVRPLCPAGVSVD